MAGKRDASPTATDPDCLRVRALRLILLNALWSYALFHALYRLSRIPLGVKAGNMHSFPTAMALETFSYVLRTVLNAVI